MKRISLILVLSGLLSACGEPTVDGSSQQAFEESIKEMTEGLTSEEERQLGRDIAQISSLKEMNVAHVVSASHRQKLQETVRAELDGKSLEEITKLASVARLQARTKERDALVEELQAAEERLEAAKQERNKIAQIDIFDVSVETVEVGFDKYEHKIKFTLTNGTNDTLKSVGLDALVTKKSTGSGAKFDVTADIPAQLGPGETTEAVAVAHHLGNVSPEDRAVEINVDYYIKTDRSGVGNDSVESEQHKVNQLKEKLKSDFGDLST